MFTTSRPESSLKQPVTFLASLFLQSAVLVIICGISFPPMSGPSIRHSAARSSSVTPVYFHEDVPASATGPELAESKPTPPAESTQQTKNEVQDSKDTKDTDGTSDQVQEATSWQMDSMPTGSFMMMNHQVSVAQPVFTPEPPIMHREFPELARGKDVLLEVLIDNQGSIVQINVLQEVGNGVEALIAETLRRWVFIPAKFDGTGVTSRRQLRFHFPD